MVSLISGLHLCRLLYLHCNQLDDWTMLDTIKKMQKLSRLTLHCNPLSNKKAYCPTVIANLPQLKSLDFVLISEEERDIARLEVIARFFK